MESNKKMKSTTKGPIDAFVSQKLEKVVQLWKEGKIKQSSIMMCLIKRKEKPYVNTQVDSFIKKKYHLIVQIQIVLNGWLKLLDNMIQI